MFLTPVICSNVCDNSEGLICRAREAQVERRFWVMIQQSVIIRAVQEPSLQHHKHRQSQRFPFNCFLFCAGRGERGVVVVVGGDGGREETFAFFLRAHCSSR